MCVTLPGVPEIFSVFVSPQSTVALYPLPSVGKTNVSDALPDCVVSTINWNPENTVGDGEGVIDGVGVKEGVKLGVTLDVGVTDGLTKGDSDGVILGVTDGLTDGVILGVGVIDDVGVSDGVTDGVEVIVGVTVGVTDGNVGHVPHIGLLPSIKGQPPSLNVAGSEGIGNTHHRVKSWLNVNAPSNI